MEFKEKFLDYIKYEKKYSDYTFKFYKRDLEEFEDFLKTQGEIIIDYRTIKAYMYHLTKKNNTRRTIARKLSSLKSYYKFLRNNKLSEENPFALVEKQHISKRLPEMLILDEVLELMDVNISKKEDINHRNYLIVRILYATGVRVSELVNMCVEDIDFYEMNIKVRGKGDKDRFVFIDDDTLDYLRVYLSSFRNECKEEKGNYLFLNKFGKKLTSRSIELILQEKGRNLKNPKEVYPHMLRHSYASSLIENGADLRVIQELLGHTSLQATQIYTSLSNQKLQQKYLDAHPHSKK